MSAKPLVLLVGHCMADSFSLSRLVKQAASGAEVERVNSDRALQKHLNESNLLLVNRVLDGRFEFAEGVPLLASLRAKGITAPIMLISNYADAQESAVQAGAAPGFGKRDIRDPATMDKVRTALGIDTASSA